MDFVKQHWIILAVIFAVMYFYRAQIKTAIGGVTG